MSAIGPKQTCGQPYLTGKTVGASRWWMTAPQSTQSRKWYAKKTWAEIWAMRAEELRADDVELDEHADVFNLSENHKTMEMK
jgi:hypothetical protein